MGRKVLVPTLVASLMSLWVIAGLAQTAERNAVGTWKLDIAKSSYGSLPAPKFEQLVVTTDKPDAAAWSITGASADGKSFTESYDGPVDGTYHPLTSTPPGMTIAYRRASSGELRWTMKDSSGAVIETAHGKVSKDLKSLTLKGTAQGPNGKSDFVSVFAKAQ